LTGNRRLLRTVAQLLDWYGVAWKRPDAQQPETNRVYLRPRSRKFASHCRGGRGWRGADLLRGARRRAIACACVVLIAPASAGAAGKTALQPGVHIDPGSPAAKEYAIPLQQARGQSPGGSGGGGMFGSGIEPTGSAPVRRARPASHQTHRRLPNKARRPLTHRRTSHSSTSALGDTGAVVATRRTADTSGPLSGVEWMLAAGVLILAVGGLGGAVLSRFGSRARTRTS
jgi:hypothetical protein